MDPETLFGYFLAIAFGLGAIIIVIRIALSIGRGD